MFYIFGLNVLAVHWMPTPCVPYDTLILPSRRDSTCCTRRCSLTSRYEMRNPINHCQISETLDSRMLPEHFRTTLSQSAAVTHFESRAQKNFKPGLHQGILRWETPGSI